MLSWGAKRRLIIILSAIGIVLVAFSLYITPKVFKKPSCTDQKQNQGELGIDCGGPCARLCVNQSKDLSISWARAFPVTQDSYNAIVYAENLNPRSGIQDISYIIQLYDERNILVSERSGHTSIPPQRIVPIFEGDIKTGSRVPARVEFILNSPSDWVMTRTPIPELRVVDVQPVTNTETTPLLVASVQNNSENQAVRDLPLVVIVYDANGNAQSASRTVVGRLMPLSSENILFSWPARFNFVPARTEIVPLPYPGINY